MTDVVRVKLTVEAKGFPVLEVTRLLDGLPDAAEAAELFELVPVGQKTDASPLDLDALCEAALARVREGVAVSAARHLMQMDMAQRNRANILLGSAPLGVAAMVGLVGRLEL